MKRDRQTNRNVLGLSASLLLRPVRLLAQICLVVTTACSRDTEASGRRDPRPLLLGEEQTAGAGAEAPQTVIEQHDAIVTLRQVWPDVIRDDYIARVIPASDSGVIAERFRSGWLLVLDKSGAVRESLPRPILTSVEGKSIDRFLTIGVQIAKDSVHRLDMLIPWRYSLATLSETALRSGIPELPGDRIEFVAPRELTRLVYLAATENNEPIVASLRVDNRGELLGQTEFQLFRLRRSSRDSTVLPLLVVRTSEENVVTGPQRREPPLFATRLAVASNGREIFVSRSNEGAIEIFDAEGKPKGVLAPNFKRQAVTPSLREAFLRERVSDSSLLDGPEKRSALLASPTPAFQPLLRSIRAHQSGAMLLIRDDLGWDSDPSKRVQVVEFISASRKHLGTATIPERERIMLFDPPRLCTKQKADELSDTADATWPDGEPKALPDLVRCYVMQADR